MNDEPWSVLKLEPFPFSIAVVNDEETFGLFCDAKGIKDRRWIDDDTQADVMNFGNHVLVRFNAIHDLEPLKRVPIVAHEGTHVFQALCTHIAESNPSDEFQAYYIGHITGFLHGECEAAIRRLQNIPSENQPES